MPRFGPVDCVETLCLHCVMARVDEAISNSSIKPPHCQRREVTNGRRELVVASNKRQLGARRSPRFEEGLS